MPKPDRRTERTHAALMSAFVGVMLEEGYEAVTMEGIAARADVGRSTFYMHYAGKEDILRRSLERPSSVLAVLVGHDLAVDVLTRQLVHFHDQRRRNHVFFAGPVRAIWVRCLAALIEPRLTALARRLHARPRLPLSLAALQIAECQIALVASWLARRPGTAADAVAGALAATTRAMVAALLDVRHDAALTIPGERVVVRQA